MSREKGPPFQSQATEIDFSGGEFPLPQATNEGHNLLREFLGVDNSTSWKVKKFTWKDRSAIIEGNSLVSWVKRLISWPLEYDPKYDERDERKLWEQISTRRHEPNWEFMGELKASIDYNHCCVYVRSFPYPHEDQLYNLGDRTRQETWQRLQILKALTQAYLFSEIIPQEPQKEDISLYSSLTRGDPKWLFEDILAIGTQIYSAIWTERKLIESGLLQPNDSICSEEEQKICFGTIAEKGYSPRPFFVPPRRLMESQKTIEAFIKATQTTIWPRSFGKETARIWTNLLVKHQYVASARTLGYFFIRESLRGTPPEQSGEHLRTIFTQPPENLEDLMTPSKWRS